MIAFYAPLKPPSHPTPSGDRAIARALLSALEGHDPRIVSTLRSYDGKGDAAAQEALFTQAKAEVDRLLADPDVTRWRAWLTYHNYYKAPDLIGPSICQALNIPYLQIESTRARKRLTGPWAHFAAAAEAASDAARVIFHLTARDAEALYTYAPPGQRIEHLRPFLDRTDLPQQSACDGPMLAVGMMRPGDKLASYQLIAKALRQMQSPDWRLNIIGSGSAENEVRALMDTFGPRVQMLGPVAPEEMGKHYAQAGLLLWPGVNEAFGLTYLEAQAHGLPVVAQDRPGVRDVVADGLVPAAMGTTGLAARLDSLTAPAARKTAGAKGRKMVGAHHLRGAATTSLSCVLKEVFK